MSSKKYSSVAYYADFFIYTFMTIVLGVLGIFFDGADQFLSLTMAAIAGMILWTLVEYILHRAVLHHMPYMRELHDKHHHSPKALIESPIWMGLVFALGGVLFPASIILGFAHGACFTAGMMLGYVVYATMHHGMHHWRIPHGTYLYRAKRRHALHHAFHDAGNYGVSTAFWDYVFGTNLPDPAHSRQRHADEMK